MHTTKNWWAETKADEAKLAHWLKRQYIGELAAVKGLDWAIKAMETEVES